MEGHGQQAPRPPTPTTNERVIVLSENADLTISVYSVKDSDGRRSLTHFKVEKSKLVKQEYFRSSLRFNSTFSHSVRLKDDNIEAMRVWLVYIHATNDEEVANEEVEKTEEERAAAALKEDNKQKSLFQRDGVFDTNITRIWHIINLGDKYLFDSTLLQGFFEKWYERNVDILRMEPDFARQLALPCYMFDHAVGFACITKWLAYNFKGHITEKRPPGFKWRHMHLCPPDFVGELDILFDIMHVGLILAFRANEPRSWWAEDLPASWDLGVCRPPPRRQWY